MMRPDWKDVHGVPISCLEKRRLLDENAVELEQVIRDAWDDALLMGVAPAIMRTYLEKLVTGLKEGSAS